jgi:hypothetical protein
MGDVFRVVSYIPHAVFDQFSLPVLPDVPQVLFLLFFLAHHAHLVLISGCAWVASGAAIMVHLDIFYLVKHP